jgi:hypothetical protein
MRSRYSGALIGGTGPISATSLAPAVELFFRPSVKSQTLPAIWAAKDAGPSAACAAASVERFSIRQYSGPAGNSRSVFSATFLITNFCGGAAAEGASGSPLSDRGSAAVRMIRQARRIIAGS